MNNRRMHTPHTTQATQLTLLTHSSMHRTQQEQKACMCQAKGITAPRTWQLIHTDTLRVSMDT